MASTGKWIEGIGPDSRINDAARRSLEPRLATVARFLPLAAHLAEHDIEHVHRLRVATRRAVAALKLYCDGLPGKPARWLKKRLRKIRRAAGDARDLDVLAKRIAEDDGDRLAPISARIADERAEVQPTILRIAERCGEDDRFIRKTAKLLRSIGPDDSSPADKLHAAFRDFAVAQLGSAALPFLEAMPDETADAAALHAFRIRAKAVRYTVELLAAAFGTELREEAYPIVEKVQERLGRVQDHVTARQLFQKWAAAETDVARQELLEESAEKESVHLTEAVRDFHRWWTDDRVQSVRAVIQSCIASRPHGQLVPTLRVGTQ